MDIWIYTNLIEIWYDTDINKMTKEKLAKGIHAWHPAREAASMTCEKNDVLSVLSVLYKC